LQAVIPLIGYADRFSARPGERIAVKVSSQSDHPYQADLVRIIHADANPTGPGIKLEEIAADFAGAYASRVQPVHLGSCAVVTPAEPITLPNPCTIVVRVQPWLLDGRPQTVMAIEGGPVLSVAPEGARLGLGGRWAQVEAPMLKGRWYELRLIAIAEQLRLRQIALQHSCGVTDFGSAEMPGSLGMLRKLAFGAASTAQPGPNENPCCCFFNGRLEDPAILHGVHEGGAPIEPGEAECLAWLARRSRPTGSSTAGHTGCMAICATCRCARCKASVGAAKRPAGGICRATTPQSISMKTISTTAAGKPISPSKYQPD
jgi:N,N-dimethylformamidase